ncbi:flagellin [Candidatus Saccharibacteria bacterium]|nr:flagellin [Candidatus Saccharibacteria bacterium]
MSLTIKHNLMASNTARNLAAHYDSLGSSTLRLSSGFRVNQAADDAAGLTVREMMRSDVRTLEQGARNANDAISMIQVADGALQVINEKLIRMKELATQAAAGTYSSTQRAIIDDEFQEMKSEIYRIAKSTDFNGIKLLDGTLSGTYNGSGLESSGEIKIHFGTGNDSSEDYYYTSIQQIQDERFNLGGEITSQSSWAHQGGAVNAEVMDELSITEDVNNFEVYYHISSPRQTQGTEGTPLFLRAHGSIPYDFNISIEIQALWAWSEFNGYAS